MKRQLSPAAFLPSKGFFPSFHFCDHKTPFLVWLLLTFRPFRSQISESFVLINLIAWLSKFCVERSVEKLREMLIKSCSALNVIICWQSSKFFDPQRKQNPIINRSFLAQLPREIFVLCQICIMLFFWEVNFTLFIIFPSYLTTPVAWHLRHIKVINKFQESSDIDFSPSAFLRWLNLVSKSLAFWMS